MSIISDPPMDSLTLLDRPNQQTDETTIEIYDPKVTITALKCLEQQTVEDLDDLNNEEFGFLDPELDKPTKLTILDLTAGTQKDGVGSPTGSDSGVSEGERSSLASPTGGVRTSAEVDHGEDSNEEYDSAFVNIHQLVKKVNQLEKRANASEEELEEVKEKLRNAKIETKRSKIQKYSLAMLLTCGIAYEILQLIMLKDKFSTECDGNLTNQTAQLTNDCGFVATQIGVGAGMAILATANLVANFVPSKFSLFFGRES